MSFISRSCLKYRFYGSPHCQFKGEKDSLFIMVMSDVMSKRPRLSCYFVLGAQITQAGIKLRPAMLALPSSAVLEQGSHLGSGLIISCCGQQLRVPTDKSALTLSP